jgi:hypothetical protein
VQTEEVLKKIDRSLIQSASDKSKILWCNVWLTDIREKKHMDAACQSWVDAENKPARYSRIAPCHARYARGDHDDLREVNAQSFNAKDAKESKGAKENSNMSRARLIYGACSQTLLGRE